MYTAAYSQGPSNSEAAVMTCGLRFLHQLHYRLRPSAADVPTTIQVLWCQVGQLMQSSCQHVLEITCVEQGVEGAS